MCKMNSRIKIKLVRFYRAASGQRSIFVSSLTVCQAAAPAVPPSIHKIGSGSHDTQGGYVFENLKAGYTSRISYYRLRKQIISLETTQAKILQIAQAGHSLNYAM
jgi:hypothetical protein